MHSAVTASTSVWTKVHAYVGVGTLIAFLLTGQYMDKVHAHLVGMADAPRMLYRSAHIYLLWSGLLNLVVALYVQKRSSTPACLWVVGSSLILAAPPLMLAAFFVEPTLEPFHRPYSRAGNYSAAIGVLLYLWGARRRGP